MKENINSLNLFFSSETCSQSRQFKYDIADFFPALVFIYNTSENRFSYANRKFRDYFGLQEEDILEMKPEDIVGRDWDKLQENFLSVAEGEARQFNWLFRKQELFQMNLHLLNCDEMLVLAQSMPKILNKEATTILDIYSETEELLQFGSWTWDPQSMRVEWSSGIFAILGYHPDEVEPSARLFLHHISKNQTDEIQQLLDDSARYRNGFEIEFEIRTKNDDLKVVHSKGKPVTDATGQLKIVGILRDITAVKSAEREKERTLKELNRSNRELEEFAYVASHDLQEPLRKIAMFSERLKVKYSDAFEKDGQVFMERILASADNMKVLIDNLLEFSKANRSSQNFAWIDLKSVIDDVLTELELKIEETAAQVVVTSTLPHMEAVYSEMKQLFTNLISNAIKFRKPGVDAVITLNVHKATNAEKKHFCLRAEETYFVIDVKDNGIGFEQEYADKIFQIFHRLHGKSEYPGSGIGLAICKRIIDNHNGTINAISAPLQGATFTVVLPQKQF